MRFQNDASVTMMISSCVIATCNPHRDVPCDVPNCKNLIVLIAAVGPSEYVACLGVFLTVDRTTASPLTCSSRCSLFFKSSDSCPGPASSLPLRLETGENHQSASHRVHWHCLCSKGFDPGSFSLGSTTAVPFPTHLPLHPPPTPRFFAATK